MALAGPLSVWRDPWGRPVRRRDFIKLPGGAAAGNVEAIRAAARTRGVEIVARELHGADDLPLTFDDVKSVGAQAAIFKLRYSSCNIHDGHCIVRTAEEDCGNRACSQASVDPFVCA